MSATVHYKKKKTERERERERRLTHYFHRAQIQNSSMTMKQFCTHLILCFWYHILLQTMGGRVWVMQNGIVIFFPFSKHVSKEAHLSHKDVLLLLLVSTLLLLSEKIKLHGSSGSTSLPNGDKILLHLLKLLLRLA
jgi:hypothetical protein